MRQDVLRVGLLVGAVSMWSPTHGRAADPALYLNAGAGMNFISEVDVAGSTLSFDPGLRFNVAGGYHFTPMISAEIETGFLLNDVEDAGDTSFSQVPFLANVVFRFQNSSPFIPFIGVGVGGVAAFLTIDDIISEDEDSDIVFAWQLQAGVHYKINDNMSAGITYKYLGVDSPEFDLGGGIVDFDVTHNHAIMASFNWSF